MLQIIRQLFLIPSLSKAHAIKTKSVKTEFMPAKSSIFTKAKTKSKPSKATPYPTF